MARMTAKFPESLTWKVLPPSTGKTNLVQTMMLERMRRGESAAFLNLEMSPKKVERMIEQAGFIIGGVRLT